MPLRVCIRGSILRSFLLFFAWILIRVDRVLQGLIRLAFGV